MVSSLSKTKVLLNLLWQILKSAYISTLGSTFHNIEV